MSATNAVDRCGTCNLPPVVSVKHLAACQKLSLTPLPLGSLTMGANEIGRITVDGVIMEFSVGITAGAGLCGISDGTDGNIWFTEYEVGQIGRITPAGVVTEYGFDNPASIAK